MHWPVTVHLHRLQWLGTILFKAACVLKPAAFVMQDSEVRREESRAVSLTSHLAGLVSLESDS